jgi:hypothetical protein
MHFAGAAFAHAMRVVPRRWRFRAASLFAFAAQPLFRRTSAYRVQRAIGVDSIGEISLHMVTDALTVHGTEFDPEVTIEGYDVLVKMYGEGRGVLLIQPHAVLTHLQFRVFHDRGLRPVGITTEADLRFPGTRTLANVLAPSPTFLVTVRNRLREGRLVWGAVDRAEHTEGRTIELETVKGRIIVATPLLEIALRCGSRIGFTDVHLRGGRVLGRIAPGKSDTAEGLAREFAEFLGQRHASSPGVLLRSPTEL